MNRRFSKCMRNWLSAACVLTLCVGNYSCSDDYDLDDSTPSWLDSSIYNYLSEKGNYTNFVKLIDDLDYAEVLAKTGSKTLFVADDDAFAKFYENNSWGVSNYSQLSSSQKKLLLKSAMLNNAYLLEMMTNLSTADGIEENMCLRRETSIDVTDSITHLNAADLPVSYNPDDKDYWARFREPSKGGIYVAMDNTAQMMTHFLAGQMGENNITDSDFEILLGTTRDKNDAYIYNSKVLQQDIVCQNGYINVLDRVLTPYPNMAEVIRTNGKTNIFSHMIERFSAPFYNADLTNRVQLLGNNVDSVWVKRYFSKRSQGNTALSNDRNTDPIGDPTGKDVAFYLNFDPGWNFYQSDDRTTKEEDMGVIFAPTDSRLYDYFFTADGGGRFLLEAYAPDMMNSVTSPTDYETIYKVIDQIPLSVIQALINNLMKVSFNSSVPSKFETIKDDAQDPMVDEEDLQYIEDVLLANNGIVYLMDEVLTPAQYAAVSAPAYVARDMQIFKFAFTRETLDIQTNFYAYLLAMSSRFSFFVPSDNEFWYIDPVSFANNTGEQRAYLITWDAINNRPKAEAYEYIYDYTTGQGYIGSPLSNVSLSDNQLYNRLRDMLNTHTIVHEDDTERTGIDETATGIECEKHYFLSKSGAPLYVENATQREKGCVVKGGWQLANGSECKVIRFDDKTAETNGNGNGMAYEIDTPILPTIESVFSVLYNDSANFNEFYKLCQTDVEVLKEIGITATTDQRKYTIFVNDNGLPCYDKTTGNRVSTATNVRFFNNYRYTVYIPTNEAILDAISRGLPTWEDLREILELDVDPEMRKELTEDEEKARNEKCLAMVTTLVNFVKYHFQDNSIFADTPALSETQYESSTLNVETGVYCKLAVSSQGNGTLSVKDLAGHTRNITSKKNIITRDYVLNASSNPQTISGSSFAVVHGIDGVLDHKSYTNGRYDSDWASLAAARRYLNTYRIIE